MQSDQYQKSRDTGKNVWEAFVNQVAEGGGFLHAMFQSFRSFIRKNILFILVFGVVFGAASAGYWFVKPQVYEAEMTVSYVHYEKKIYADMLAKLNRLVSSGDFTKLSKMLDMPEESVRNIHSITGFNIRKEPLVDDLSTEKVPFYIVVNITQLDILQPLETALVKYLNGTKFIQGRLNFMRKKATKELEFLDQRLAIADSLSKLMVLKPESANDEKTITRMELLGETMTIYSRIQDVQGLLEFNVNIEILDGFVATKQPVGKGLTTYILYGFLVGIGLRFLVLIFR